MKLRKYLSVALLVMLFCGLAGPARGEEPEPVEIATVADLLAMAENPSDSYILTADLDMTGTEWKSLDFSGSFDGNGHAILNLTLSQPSDSRPKSYDGNNKGYEAAYVGFFGTLVNAQVKNLKLLNVRGLVETHEPCFLAGIAGFADHSLVENCTVTGCLELRAHDRMFGVAGIIGSGNCTVTGCTVDMTLICTDTDAAAKDEQFLGGVFGTGFVSVTDCEITLDAYISDHGYVHSGGIGGMHMRYPLPDWKTVAISPATVSPERSHSSRTTGTAGPTARRRSASPWHPTRSLPTIPRIFSGMSGSSMTPSCGRSSAQSRSTAGKSFLPPAGISATRSIPASAAATATGTATHCTPVT